MTAVGGARSPDLEIWGGVECSVVRVGDVYRDNVRRSGHHDRKDDLDRFAALGLRAFRQPVLWERVAPDGLSRADWSWTDERLGRLRELGIRPIVGLLHHGSGPASTHLLDPQLPAKLAEFAAAVAERYPWVDAYTPVNEPLTTARFSALYGHWYPHARSREAFLRALTHQCLGTAAAMRRIREVNPGAALVQTEDFAHVTSTPKLAYQAAYENERRWLSLDLLVGKVTSQHRFFGSLVASGVSAEALAELASHPAPPDVIGVNYYVTSERFLDERTALHSPQHIGSNGVHAYADVETVRVSSRGVLGHEGALAQTWERFGIPLALTEVHLGCTRDEQLRWLQEAWRACRAARARGIDVRALTPWALLGSHEWSSLLVEERGDYEPGIFDLRGEAPRATALASMVECLAKGVDFDHPALDGRGWWRRSSRLVHASYGESAPVAAVAPPAPLRGRDVLVRGDASPLVEAILRAAASRDLRCRTAAAGARRAAGPRAWGVIDVGRRRATVTTSLPTLFLELAPGSVVVRGGAPFCADDGASLVADCRAGQGGGLDALANAALDLLLDASSRGLAPLADPVAPFGEVRVPIDGLDAALRQPARARSASVATSTPRLSTRIPCARGAS